MQPIHLCNEVMLSNRLQGENTLRFESHQLSTRSNNEAIKNQNTASFDDPLSATRPVNEQKSPEVERPERKAVQSASNVQEIAPNRPPKHSEYRNSKFMEMQVYSHRKKNDEKHNDSTTAQKSAKPTSGEMQRSQAHPDYYDKKSGRVQSNHDGHHKYTTIRLEEYSHSLQKRTVI